MQLLNYIMNNKRMFFSCIFNNRLFLYKIQFLSVYFVIFGTTFGRRISFVLFYLTNFPIFSTYLYAGLSLMVHSTCCPRCKIFTLLKQYSSLEHVVSWDKSCFRNYYGEQIFILAIFFLLQIPTYLDPTKLGTLSFNKF